MKSLYNILETDNHWFATYHNHHVNRLNMNQSTYYSCLIYKSLSSFDIMSMQIDDILILAKQSFANAEEDVIVFVEIMIKARDHL
jgi:hypothetical protein